MTLHSHIRALRFAAALAPAITAGAAHANDISFISTAGSNANACTLAAPCRSLQRAISVTAEGGEIRVLDSGFFGNNATIRKSLTITGNGNTIHLGNTLTVDNASAVVALPELLLSGQGGAIDDGILIAAAKTGHIEDCVVHGFGLNGILVTGTGTQAFVIGSTVRDNGVGLEVIAGTTTRISDSIFVGNFQGIRVNSTGVVETRENNTVRGNTFNATGGLTPIGGI